MGNYDLMAEDTKDKPYTNKVSQFMRDFMDVQLHFSQLPIDLAKARSFIDDMRFDGGPQHQNVYTVLYNMMNFLYPDKKPRTGTLSRALTLSLSTTTRMVDFLVKRGYCERLSDHNDKRIIRVALTDSGRQDLEASEGYVAQRGQEILTGLTQKEKATLFALYGKIAMNIRRTKDAP